MARTKDISEVVAMLADRGIADQDFMASYTPSQVISVCEKWARRVGVVATGSAAVAIASGARYPGLFEELLREEFSAVREA